MYQCITFILFWNDTVHVSDDPPVHHQEFKTVHTVTASIWLYYRNLSILLMLNRFVFIGGYFTLITSFGIL